MLDQNRKTAAPAAEGTTIGFRAFLKPLAAGFLRRIRLIGTDFNLLVEFFRRLIKKILRF